MLPFDQLDELCIAWVNLSGNTSDDSITEKVCLLVKDIYTMRPQDRNELLGILCSYSYYPAVKYMLDLGYSVQDKELAIDCLGESSGGMPENDLEIIKLFLDRGANPNKLLYNICKGQNDEISYIQEIIRRGATNLEECLIEADDVGNDSIVDYLEILVPDGSDQPACGCDQPTCNSKESECGCDQPTCNSSCGCDQP